MGRGICLHWGKSSSGARDRWSFSNVKLLYSAWLWLWVQDCNTRDLWQMSILAVNIQSVLLRTERFISSTWIWFPLEPEVLPFPIAHPVLPGICCPFPSISAQAKNHGLCAGHSDRTRNATGRWVFSETGKYTPATGQWPIQGLGLGSKDHSCSSLKGLMRHNIHTSKAKCSPGGFD